MTNDSVTVALMRKMGLTDVATVSYTTPSEGLGVRALNARPPGIVGGERGRLLPLPCDLDRLVVGVRPDGELARRMFSPGARLADRTCTTGRGMETDRTTGSPETSRPGVHLRLVCPWGQRAWRASQSIGNAPQSSPSPARRW